MPFIAVNKTDISSKFHGLDYEVTTPDGEFSKPDNGKVFRIKPGKNTLTLNFATGK
ncbi:hypothetical protein NAF17_03475 [Mucilaginibacter sp. RB4R14]|uniref:hypothetical protein n=1 Tax=Mucilaginibacter aurantiaciroseus TaxID=2949308 RepID=UPI0020901551|nr:hypothetical protein [Mucilaginibacter aurantiaciroseus]MCO5934592.1 hypothetical protein [Mucilaginibacter aurantiaciroseus]